ncbi:hypothetical protein LZ32DRAFT_603686 [Colletotrichum eremochloae]|nr:hypothetical protein LZ32DRAFT_603686 [Colletotrichum eremochloae]
MQWALQCGADEQTPRKPPASQLHQAADGDCQAPRPRDRPPKHCSLPGMAWHGFSHYQPRVRYLPYLPYLLQRQPPLPPPASIAHPSAPGMSVNR